VGVIDRNDCDRVRKFIRSSIIPEVGLYAKCVRERFLPTFDSLEAEAENWRETRFEELGEDPNIDRERYLPEDLWDNADEASFDWYMELDKIRQGFTNIFTVGLYHIFEQHLKSFYVDSWLSDILRPSWLGEPADKIRIKIDKVKPVINSLKDNGIDITSWPCWTHLEELRLVANTIKHGRGDSSDELEKVKPILFEHPSSRKHQCNPNIPPMNPSYRHIEFQRTITGDHIFITLTEFDQYQGAVHEFWKELSDALPSLGGRSAI
jgi:hypothetical protein